MTVIINSEQVALDNIHSAVESSLRSSGIHPTRDVNGLADIFDVRHGHYGRLFAGLETHYKQMKYCKDNFNFVVRTNQ